MLGRRFSRGVEGSGVASREAAIENAVQVDDGHRMGKSKGHKDPKEASPNRNGDRHQHRVERQRLTSPSDRDVFPGRGDRRDRDGARQRAREKILPRVRGLGRMRMSCMGACRGEWMGCFQV